MRIHDPDVSQLDTAIPVLTLSALVCQAKCSDLSVSLIDGAEKGYRHYEFYGLH